MKRIRRLARIILFDTAGILVIIASIATGWLPGPGGIPLFLIGLSLLAVHHKRAERLLDLVKEYADRAGDMIFLDNPRAQLLYDVVASVMVIAAAGLFVRRTALWMVSIGVSLTMLALLIFLRNRHRYDAIKARFKR